MQQDDKSNMSSPDESGDFEGQRDDGNEKVDPHAGDTRSHRWRLAGVTHQDEVDAWRASGVFDGHRAGLLRAAGVTPRDVQRLDETMGWSIGYEFAIGRLSVRDVVGMLAACKSRSSRSTG